MQRNSGLPELRVIERGGLQAAADGVIVSTA
jgi:hypothetical protein